MFISHENNSPLSHCKPFDTLVLDMIQHIKNSAIIVNNKDSDLQSFLSQFGIDMFDYITPNCTPSILLNICHHQSFCPRRYSCYVTEPTCVKPTDAVQATEHCGLFCVIFPIGSETLYVYYSFGDTDEVRNNILKALVGYCKERIEELQCLLSADTDSSAGKSKKSLYNLGNCFTFNAQLIREDIKAYEDFIETIQEDFSSFRLFEL